AEGFDAMLGRLECAFDPQERFVADAAHELRTPLATLRATMDLALEEGQQGDERAALETCRRQLDRLERLPHGPRVPAARDRPEADGVVWLGPVLEEVCDSFRQRAKNAGIQLRLAGDGAVAVRGDQDHLARLAANLVDNALRHTPPGGQVTMSLARTADRV